MTRLRAPNIVPRQLHVAYGRLLDHSSCTQPVQPAFIDYARSRRIELQTHEYTQVVLYDHVTRRKT